MNYVEEILEHGNSEKDKFFAIADIVAAKEAEDSFKSLKMEEKNIYMIDKLLSEINNGGLDQYFFNTDGKYLTDTVNVLKQLEQHEFAEILNQAAKIYNEDIKAEDRFDILNEFDEEIYSQIDFEELYNSCLRYVGSYSDKFN